MSFTVPRADPEPDTFIPSSVVGALLIDALAPWATLHLAWYLNALGLMLDQLYALVSDVGVDDGSMPTIGTYDADGNLVTAGFRPGYGVLLDPSAAKLADLTYLGQFVGVPVPVGADDATARSLVRDEAGLNRGTPSAIVAAAQRFLSGSQTVTLLERVAPDGSPRGYWFQLVVLTGEVLDVQGLTDAVNAVKPGGVMWKLIETATWTISELEAAYATINDVEAAFSTVSRLERDVT